MRLLAVRGPSESECQDIERPWRQEQLEPHGVYVLHWRGQQLWVWTGNRAGVKDKEHGFSIAAALQKDDANMHVSATAQFAEHPLFRAHFQGWSEDVGRGGWKNAPALSSSSSSSSSSSAVSSGGTKPLLAVGGGGLRQPLADGNALIIAKDKSTLVLEERAKQLNLQELEETRLQVPLLTPAIKHDDGSSGAMRIWTIQKGICNI
jgi:hypothetical protein